MMRAFVLSTGRCGSTTWARACEHLPDYTVGHESRTHIFDPDERVAYPDGHIEVDNRLSWYLGALDERYGRRGDVVWVHLFRDPDLVAASYARRYGVHAGIMPAFANGIVRAPMPWTPDERLAAARAMVDTVNGNIAAFLRGKANVVNANIDRPHQPFDRMAALLGVSGDIYDAHETLDRVHNAGRIRRSKAGVR